MVDEVQHFQRVDGVHIETNAPTEKILENIQRNVERYSAICDDLTKSEDWREGHKVAIVGGGPSLKETINDLKYESFHSVIAAGSVHDYLVGNNIYSKFCVICDPDPLVLDYIKKPTFKTTYLVASQCDPMVFEYLNGYDVRIWHLYCSTPEDYNKPRFDHGIYGPDVTPIGGGCTVGTRSMVIALGMGYTNLHLFGFDNCVDKHGERYAYPLQNQEYETALANDFHEIGFEQDGPIFRVLGYQLAQLFDIKALSRLYANKMVVTVHGDGLLKYYYELADRKLKKIKEQYPNEELTPQRLEEILKNNGNSSRPNGVG